ncbi:MAG: hypothetical protein EOO46_08395 [Flavobacterium sp.]|nr:MAG: hypothetical protein EOO46_08395 [Flavobacterium sp.]
MKKGYFTDLIFRQLKNTALLFALLVAFSSYSQFDRGSITLLDGTVLKGFVKVNRNSFKFKAGEGEKAVKYDYTTAVGATVLLSEYEFVKVESHDKPLLLVAVKKGFLNLYALFEDVQIFNPNGFGMEHNTNTAMTSTYYIKKKTDELAYFFIARGTIPETGFKKVVKDYFTDCPLLQEKVEKGEFKKRDFEAIVLFYNDNCAPKK